MVVMIYLLFIYRYKLAEDFFKLLFYMQLFLE
jgi:hypothetical protein